LENAVKYCSILLLAAVPSQSNFRSVSLGWSLLQKIFTNILLATSRSSHKVLQSDVEGSLLARDKSRFSSLVTLVKDVMEKPKTYKHDNLASPFPLF
jgi:hypothetical protein